MFKLIVTVAMIATFSVLSAEHVTPKVKATRNIMEVRCAQFASLSGNSVVAERHYKLAMKYLGSNVIIYEVGVATGITMGYALQHNTSNSKAAHMIYSSVCFQYA